MPKEDKGPPRKLTPQELRKTQPEKYNNSKKKHSGIYEVYGVIYYYNKDTDLEFLHGPYIYVAGVGTAEKEKRSYPNGEIEIYATDLVWEQAKELKRKLENGSK